jgi:CRISPR-associated Cas5-like protein
VKFVLFYHSIVSDWNHGNAHFLRGVVTELLDRGHEVDVYEPANAWSLENLVRDHGEKPLDDFRLAFPQLTSTRYSLDSFDLDAALDGADVVIVHEWSDYELVRRIGAHRARTRAYRLFFHDTHHRAATQPELMAQYDLRDYDGVLAYGAVIRDLYLKNGWSRAAWTWHEAADTRVFRPRPHDEPEAEVVWIGNWGDEERTTELHEFLIDPVKELGLRGRVHGVRYPDDAIAALRDANLEYRGWLANWKAPEVFSRHRLTVHVPRRPYVTTLRGIPTIRPFEALACAIPLVSAPWEDAENLFTPGEDFLVARDGNEMKQHMDAIVHDWDLARALASHGLQTIQDRHTCAHRVSELLEILETLQPAHAPKPNLQPAT